jgi:hypothetical protein
MSGSPPAVFRDFMGRHCLFAEELFSGGIAVVFHS